MSNQASNHSFNPYRPRARPPWPSLSCPKPPRRVEWRPLGPGLVVGVDGRVSKHVGRGTNERVGGFEIQRGASCSRSFRIDLERTRRPGQACEVPDSIDPDTRHVIGRAAAWGGATMWCAVVDAGVGVCRSRIARRRRRRRRRFSPFFARAFACPCGFLG